MTTANERLNTELDDSGYSSGERQRRNHIIEKRVIQQKYLEEENKNLMTENADL